MMDQTAMTWLRFACGNSKTEETDEVEVALYFLLCDEFASHWLHKTLKPNTETVFFFYPNNISRKPRGCKRLLFHRKRAFITKINNMERHLHIRNICFLQ